MLDFKDGSSSDQSGALGQSFLLIRTYLLAATPAATPASASSSTSAMQ